MIEAFIIVWNESQTIKLTIDHYKQFCDKITFFDNHSNDGTQEIIKSNGCELNTFGTPGQLEDKEYIKIKNNCWKRSQADWVIVCDCDEIIWHDNIKEVFENADGTIFKTIGFDIFSQHMPKESFLELQRGIPSENYSKLAVFSPKIKSINYVYGCHVADPVGNIKYCSEKLNLFHYRNIGGANRLIKRHKLYRERLSEYNKRFGLGVHYTYDDERRKQDWYDSYNKADCFNSNGLV